MSGKYIVLKFGSSVFQNNSDISTASHEIYRYIREGYKVLAVVSAIGDKTNDLGERASQISENPSGIAKAFLMATGEQQSAAYLTLKLENIGIPTRPVDPREIDFLSVGDVEDATPKSVNIEKVFELFEANDVLVLPGFYAAHEEFGISLLGRGGSDFSALFLASQIGVGCRVRLLKDVDGLYERDPSLNGPEPRRYTKVRWGHAIRVANELVQPKAIEFAKERAQQIEVAKCNDFTETLIGTEGPIFDTSFDLPKPLKVGLLGLGTVGHETYNYLKAEKDRFEVVGVGVRNIKAYKNHGVSADILTNNINDILEKKPDILIEAIGGFEPALAVLSKALDQGIHVISANKDLFAKYGNKLNKHSENGGGKILYSASVGGGIPILEAIDIHSKGNGIQAIEGVLNGTTNFIIGKLEEGIEFKEALKEAQYKGFAEANPDNDILGWDAVFKLSLCSERAFNIKPLEQDIERDGIIKLTPEYLKKLEGEGKTIRHIGKCWNEDGRIKVSVKPEVICNDHYLAGAKAEKNRAIITKSDGEKVYLSGKGAGAIPTATSVFSDTLRIYRSIVREQKSQLNNTPYSEDIKKPA